MLTRFSNASHPGSHNENQLTLWNARTELKTDLRFSHDREPVQMYTYICFQRTGQDLSWNSDPVLRVLWIIYWFLLFFCYSSPVAITFFLIMLLLFSHYYSSVFFTITLLFTFLSHTAITLLPLLFFSRYYYYSLFYSYYCSILLLLLFSHCSYSFPVAVTFLTWRCSFRVMKSFNYLIRF